MPVELPDPLFEREYASTDPNGNSGVIKLLIGKPYRAAETNGYADWRCPFQLVGIGSEKVREARGVDAIDALLVSLQMADAWLKSYSHWKITWFDQAEYLGLSLQPPVELTDEERTIFDPEKFFEEIFEEFFRNYKPKRRDSPD